MSDLGIRLENEETIYKLEKDAARLRYKDDLYRLKREHEKRKTILRAKFTAKNGPGAILRDMCLDMKG